ncbi:MAG: hypothetical protein OEV85_01570 [Candidatus Thorarchaeota archaeon]|nr:hypothetical protein [Candidatus Thorarchaeota archaeon]
MIEARENGSKSIVLDMNFLMMLVGALIWLLGYYLEFLNGLFRSTGFVLVCFYAAITSLKRPATLAWPGLLFGGLMQIIGYYIIYVPVISVLSPPLIVIGGVIIVYFAIPLALQRGELPVMTRLQKLIDSKMHERAKEEKTAKEPEKQEANAPDKDKQE